LEKYDIDTATAATAPTVHPSDDSSVKEASVESLRNELNASLKSKVDVFKIGKSMAN
jgi:hypothetical protein